MKNSFSDRGDLYERAKFLTIPSNCTEAHVPSLRCGQYLMHAHNHIILAAAANQLGIAVGSTSRR